MHLELQAKLQLKHLRLVWMLGVIPLHSGIVIETDRPQAEVHNASEIRATFLINFARCVEWPASAFPEGNSDFLIGVVGQGPIVQALIPFEGQTIKGHRLRLVQSQEWKDLMNCQVLYFSETELLETTRTLRLLKGRPVLTFGESLVFLKAGGMVRFPEERSHIRILLNRKAIQESNLPISSRLLSIVTMVDP